MCVYGCVGTLGGILWAASFADPNAPSPYPPSGKARGASGGKGGKGVGAAEGAVVEVEVQSGACRTAKWIFRCVF